MQGGLKSQQKIGIFDTHLSIQTSNISFKKIFLWCLGLSDFWPLSDWIQLSLESFKILLFFYDEAVGF